MLKFEGTLDSITKPEDNDRGKWLIVILLGEGGRIRRLALPDGKGFVPPGLREGDRVGVFEDASGRLVRKI